MPTAESRRPGTWLMDRGLVRAVADMGITFVRQFLAALMQLGLVLVVARLLGAEGAGAYAVALLVPSLMSQLLNLGLVSANVFLVSSARFPLEQAWAASRDLMCGVAVVGLGLGGLLVIALGAIAFPGVPRDVLLIALLVYPPLLLTGVVVGLLQALQDFRAFNVAVLVQPVLALSGVAVLWAVGNVDLRNVVLAVALSHLGGMVAALALLSRRVPLASATPSRRAYLRPALQYGMKAHASQIVAFLNYRLDLFLVNLLAGSAAAGIYTVAVRLVEQLWMVSKAVSTILFPMLSAMADDETARQRVTPIMARSVLWITLLAAGVLAAGAHPLIELLFGSEFSAAAPTLLVLLPGVVLLSCSRVLANDFAARGLVGVNLALTSAVLVVNTVANLLLIPRFGVLGAASATALAYSLNLLMRLIAQRMVTRAQWWTIVLPMPEDLGRLREALRKRWDG